MNTILHKLKLPVALMMLCCTVSVNLVMGQTRTWIGGAVAGPRNWNLAANWSGGVVPGSTNPVLIPTTTNQPQLTAAGDCSTLTFSGNSTLTFIGAGALTIGGASITTNSGITASISCPLILSSSTTTFGFGNVSSNLNVSGVISGSSNISKTGLGVLTLSALNTYTGATSVTVGILKLGISSSGSNSPLGDLTSGTSVSGSGTLDLNGFNITNTEALNLSGSGTSNSGALTNSSNTDVNYVGDINSSTCSINIPSGAISLAGNITSSTSLTQLNSGILNLGTGIISLGSFIINGTVNAGADITMSNKLTINGVLEMGTFALGGGLSTGSSLTGELRTSNLSNAAIPPTVTWNFKVHYNNTSGGQTIAGGTYAEGLFLDNSSGTQTASGNINVPSFDIPNATTFILNGNNFEVGGALSLASTAILDMGAGNLSSPDFSGMLGKVRLSGTNGIAIASGTVEYYGLGQTVAYGIYENLVINQSSGIAILDVTDVVTVNGMLILSSGTLNISNNTLFVNGGITRTSGNLGGDFSSNLNLGGVTGNPEPLFFDVSFAELGSLTLGHSTATNTVLNTPLSIYGGIIIASASDLLDLNGQNLILKSTIDNTAFIGELPIGSLIGATNVTVERYTSAKRAWRLLTIPVTGPTIRDAWAGVAANSNAPSGETPGIGTLITGHNFSVGSLAATASFDWFPGLGSTTTSSIRSYDPTTLWASATNTPLTSALGNSKEGFMLYVRGDRMVADNITFGSTVLKPTGLIKQGTVSVAVPDAFTVVGNPFAAAINLNSVYLNPGNSSAINRNFWVWDAQAGTSGAYTSISWNGIDYDLAGAANFSEVEYLTVNSGQAFFVEKSGGGNIDIIEANKAIDFPAALLRPVGNNGVSKIGITLYKTVGSTLGEQADKVIARYNDIYKTVATETFDAAKLNNFNENLGLVRNNRYLSIESRPFPTENDTLYVPFWGLAQRGYALEINSSKFLGVNQTARLIDAFTNTEKIVDLFDGTITYPFEVTSDPASSSLSRFKIVMAPAVVLAVNCTKFEASLIAGNKVKLSWSTGCEVGATNFVVERSSNGVNFSEIGSVDAKNSATGASYQLFDNQPVNGRNFYRIRSNDKAGHFAYTSIALIQLSSKQSIQVIPTVIDNKHFTLTLNQQPVGKYNLSLSNVAGQQVFQTSVNNTGLSSTHQIDFSSGVVPKGIYHLSVTDEQGNKQNIRLLINN